VRIPVVGAVSEQAATTQRGLKRLLQQQQLQYGEDTLVAIADVCQPSPVTDVIVMHIATNVCYISDAGIVYKLLHNSRI